LDFFDDTRIQSESTKRNLIRNFNNSNISPKNTRREMDAKRFESASHNYIDSTKKNIQKFLMPHSNIGNEKF